MLIYIGLIILSAFSYLSTSLRKSRSWRIIFNIINCIFLCFGYMCGSDWRQYEPMYEEINYNNLFYNYYAEPGYYIYMLVGRLLNINFWTFFIFTKIICFLVISKTITRYAYKYSYLAWTIFLPQSGFFMFIDNPMRNIIAVSIFLMSIPFLIKRDKYKYIICCVIAITFHFTAIITILFYFILDKKISTRKYIILLILIFGVFSSAELFSSILNRLSSINPYIFIKVQTYILGDRPESNGSLFSTGALLQIVFFFMILKARNHIEDKENGLIIFNGALIFIFIYRFGLTFLIFSRLQLYLVAFYVVGICYSIKAVKRNARNFVTSLLILYACFIGYKNISTVAWKYVPYTNYLTSIFDQRVKSFSERSLYNIKKTPYKKTIPSDQY